TSRVADQWLYLLKHLSTMDELPKFLDKRIFGLIFDIGELNKLTKEEMMSYEASLKRKMDADSVYNTATRIGRDEGMAAGMEKGMREKAISIAREFKKMGIPVEDIARGTGLSVE